jgi:hypothetical protein
MEKMFTMLTETHKTTAVKTFESFQNQKIGVTDEH